MRYPLANDLAVIVPNHHPARRDRVNRGLGIGRICAFLVFWIALAVLAALTPPGYAATLPPIQMHSGWVTFKNIEVRDGFKIFRRYGFMGAEADTPLPNLIMFNCSQNVAKAASHLTFVLPHFFQPNSFPRSKWLPKINVRVLIDRSLSVSMLGEYHDGELYIDLTTDNYDVFHKIMLSDALALGFGDQNDIIEFEFTEKMDGFFSEFIHKFGSGDFGKMTHYSKAGIGSVADACKAYQQGRSRKGRVNSFKRNVW